MRAAGDPLHERARRGADPSVRDPRRLERRLGAGRGGGRALSRLRRGRGTVAAHGAGRPARGRPVRDDLDRLRHRGAATGSARRPGRGLLAGPRPHPQPGAPRRRRGVDPLGVRRLAVVRAGRARIGRGGRGALPAHPGGPGPAGARGCGGGAGSSGGAVGAGGGALPDPRRARAGGGAGGAARPALPAALHDPREERGQRPRLRAPPGALHPAPQLEPRGGELVARTGLRGARPSDPVALEVGAPPASGIPSWSTASPAT